MLLMVNEDAHRKIQSFGELKMSRRFDISKFYGVTKMNFRHNDRKNKKRQPDEEMEDNIN